MNYKIDFLTDSDSAKVRNFINKEWESGHILAKSKKLFDWQYSNTNGSYNVVITKDGDEILGVLGFIPTCRYDKNLEENNIIWLALWKISKNLKAAGFGLKMLAFLQKNIKHVGIAVSGINRSLPPVYKALGYFTGELNHFYVTNKFSEIKLISYQNGFMLPKVNETGVDWKKINNENISELKDFFSKNINSQSLIQKTQDYFLNKYLLHPFYNYHVYLIFGSNNIDIALIVIRFDSHKKTNVLRIVDYYGDTNILSNAGYGLQKIMKENHVEYADFWSYGISNKIMYNLGFRVVKHDDEFIVPSYFEPFVKSNTQILFGYKNTSQVARDIIILKGDGDQDRPNQI